MRIQKINTSRIHGVIRPQYFITIPVKIVQAMGWAKGELVDFEIMGKNKLKLEKRVKKAPVESTGGVYNET